MAAENRAEFVIAFEGDAGGISSIMSAFKRQLKGDVAEIEQTTGNVTLFKNLKGDLDKAAAAVGDANKNLAKLRDLANEVTSAGESIGKDLAKGLTDAQKAAAAAVKDFDKTNAAVDKMAKTLTAAGVNTKALAAEETRLAVALRQAQDAEAQRQAKALLGLKTTNDVRAAVQQLYAAYNTLSVSGTLSVKELATAQQQLTTKVAELRSGITGVASAAKSGGGDLLSFFTRSLLPGLGIVSTLAAVGAALKDSIEQAKKYNQGLAEIGTVTNLTKDQLAALGAGARKLATDIGIDVNAALKGLFDLIRSGVPPENAIDVLRISAQAAKGALTDVATGVKAANLLIDNFGASTAQLPLLFDKIARGAHEGGATLKEFADSGGPLLSVARSLGFSFDDVLATLTVLVDKSGNAEKSFADLTKILAKIDTAEARAKLNELGITGDSLVEIFTQIGEQGLSLEKVLGLNLSAGGAKSAASLAALTKNAGELPDKLDKIKSAAGETSKNLTTLFDTPTERAARYNAAIAESEIQLGLFLGTSSKLAAAATAVLGPLNDLSAGFRANSLEGTVADNTISRWIAGLFGMAPATAEAKKGLADLAEQQRLTAEATAETDAKITKAIANLSLFAASLATSIQALQAAATRDIADISARADAQIAALDRSKAAEQATADATIAIRLKQAADTLAIIDKSEKDIAEATNKAISAREKAARDSFAKQNADATKQAEFEKKLAADSAAFRIASIASTLKQYQDLYASLITLAQNASAKAQSFEEARVSVVQKVEDAIRQIRFDALTGLDQYVARLAEVDRLVSEGRRKAAEGDIAGAKAFFDQAISQSNTLTTVVKADGTVLITTTQAQTDKLKALKGISDAANESFGDQGDAAKEGAEKFKVQADIIAGKITDLQDQYDTLKDTVAAGLLIKLEIDEADVAKVFATIEALTKDRTVKITMETVNSSGAPTSSSGGGSGEHFARGGFVGGARTTAAALNRVGSIVRRFAGGGSVFREPSWQKVPGFGSGDTVPAALQAGSFVVRKAAASYFGDSLMAKLARGYAAGGNVLTPGDIAKRIFGGGGGLSNAGATLGGFSSDPELGPTITEAFRVIQPLIDQSRSLPRSSTGQNIIDFLGAVLDLIRNSESAAAAHSLLDPIVESYAGIQAGIANSLKFHIPLVMGAMADRGDQNADGSFAIDKVSSAYEKLLKGNFPVIPKAFFERGGSASDTVPAMLTPGEWVINKMAVGRAERAAPGILHAINSMQIPRFALANMMRPPMPISRFAEGGPVGGTAGFSAGAPSGTADRGLNVTINANAADLYSDANVTKYLIPPIERMLRKAGVLP